ncbi:unnamed protein product [Spirodela intermedia]|uniref:Uncharacterized protein n=1 Tax=Spirodela intermedia TaxID=51605 RepID=A0A7I8K608_SPIIN|nr:unnamed protein product [Spirodela intermedia]
MTTLEEEHEAFTYAMQLVWTTVLPMALKAAIELNLFEIINRAGSGAQLFPEEIATVMVDRVLRLLASYYIPTYSVVNGDGGKVRRRYGPLSQGSSHRTRMASLTRFCRGGIPFNKAHGMTASEYNGTDPRFNNLFKATMFNNSTITVKTMLEIYGGFDGLGVLMDVGGGIGATLNMIISKHPSIKGINFDLPHVIADAPSFSGVEHVGGNMFASVPSGDAIFMKWILHDWSDENCLKVLTNRWKALPDLGKVIVMESILPQTPERTREAQTLFLGDLLMLAYNPGGKERTEEEFQSLAKGAGFTGFAKVCTAFGLWIMELTK